MAQASDALTVSRDGDDWTVAMSGRLDVSTVGTISPRVRKLEPGSAQRARIDLSGVESLDTSGAWIVHRLSSRLDGLGLDVEVIGGQPDHMALIDRMRRSEDRDKTVAPTFHPLVNFVLNAGEQTFKVLKDARSLVTFFGLVTVVLGRVMLKPWRLRLTSLVHHMQQAGLNSLPITGLLSLLVGVVLAFQGAFQLQKFGAEIFTVNLIGISVLREIGVLMTSIIIAGRSGSAFTAQIGTMKVNQEVDAMQTLGLDPVEVLVVPRLLAMMLTLPLVVFFANMMGLLGGGIMCQVVLDITPTAYMNQLNASITAWTFWVGMIKAPVFAFIIAMVGCYEGLQVTGSAESVGKLTTKSVVESIFLVILLDAMFSVLFAEIGI